MSLLVVDSTDEFDRRLDLRIGVATSMTGVCTLILPTERLVDLLVVMLVVDESDCSAICEAESSVVGTWLFLLVFTILLQD